MVVPSIEAGKATDLPSGDIAVQLPSSVFSGGRIENTERSTGGAARRTRDSASPAASPRSTSATAVRMRPGADRRRVSATDRAAGAGNAAALVSVAHRSSLATSAADCQRSSGSFAMHLRTTWSRVAGASGWIDVIGSGCFSRMDAIKDAWLAPANALRPVTIS